MRHEPGIIRANLDPLVERLVRIRMGWSMPVVEIAKRCGLAENSFYMIETGYREPTFKMLVRWADVLGYDLSLKPKSVHRVPVIAGALED